MTTSKSTSDLNNLAHKVGYALSKKCNAEVCVSRLPLVKNGICFAFTIGGREVGVYGGSFFDENLSYIATRIYTEFKGMVDGTKKGHAGSKGG